MNELLGKIKRNILIKKKIFITIGIFLVVLHIYMGYFIISHLNIITAADNFEDSVKRYPLLSKRILQDYPQDILINFLDLRNQLRKEVSDYGNGFGFYFEYLPTGTSIEVNGKSEFHAASLFKLPVIMAYYHYRERLNIKEDPEITLTKDMLDNQFGDLWKKGEGYKLKASEAVRLALEESDNTAARSLVPIIDRKDFEAVYEALDIDLNSDNNGAILSAKNYTSILKALFFSAVLEKKNSQEILGYLSKTKFPDKLEAGVPQGITIAHKIGDYNDDKGNEAFMDCGIVYVPRRPYALCMLSVSDELTARARMQQVSRTIYDYVSKIE